MREEIVVIGTEKEAEVFLYHNRSKYEVVMFVDKEPRRNVFRGVSVITLDSIASMRKDIKCKIVIATDKDEYIDIARQLTGYGFEEFIDFYYFKALNKKLAFFWGNCYIRTLVEYLEQFSAFNEEYWIYPHYSVHEYDRTYLPQSFFEKVSLCIYQDIQEKTNGTLYSSGGIYEKLSDKAIKIKIPNLYEKGFAFFPQTYWKSAEYMRTCEYEFVVSVYNHDSNILKKRQAEVSCDEITRQIENDEVFEKEDIMREFEKMLDVLETMDAGCDVKIATWIKEHYRDTMVFVDPGHVSNPVFMEYVSQILCILGLYEKENENIRQVVNKRNSVLLLPVYGCVRDALGLSWVDEENKTIKKGTWMMEGDSLNMQEYVEQYSYICVDCHEI